MFMPASLRWTAPPFIIDDAIVRLAQPLAEELRADLAAGFPLKRAMVNEVQNV
jgi:hypothetical protein